MFAKLSVRKPFTVLVGVILIITLGVVSFMNTSTDLLPSMNLPYAVVVTQYIGATPEQVEADVTAPIESRMGTVSGIKNVTSISNEHFSLVILEFIDTINMDSASLEIRESLDMLTYPDGAGKPMLLRLNPDMMPIMVAAVFADDMELGELSEFAEETVVPAFEGIPGVASVTASGLVRNQLFIIIDEEKIAQANERLQNEVGALIEARQAEGAAMIEETIGLQVAEAVNALTEDLISQGFPPEQAAEIAQQQLPEITEQVTAAVMEAVEAETVGQTELDLSPIAVPADMLTIEMISNILTAQNFSMPAGFVEGDDEPLMVRVGDRLRSVEDVSNLLIADPAATIAAMMELETVPDIAPVRLSEVAQVIATDNSSTQYTRVNGNPSVMVTMQKQTEFSTSDLTRVIREKMDSLSDTHSEIGLEFAIMMDQGQYIDIIVDSIVNNLIAGGILALIILLFFLRDLRPTLIVGISIPVSLLLAFALMYFTGVSLNMISMSGLALGVGMLVDNSIVVIENIYRLRNKGLPTRRAAVQGATEVAGAIAASTLTTISVFLPIVFTQGLTRQLFTDLGLTIGFSLLASLIIALTVVPAASSAIFYNMKEKKHRIFDRFRNAYADILRGALRIKVLIVLFAFAALIVSGMAVFAKGMEFIPAMDAEQIMVNIDVPEEASFDDAVDIAETISNHILTIEDVSYVGTIVSGGGSGVMSMMGEMFGMGGGGGDTASATGGFGITVYLLLEENRKMSNREIVDIIIEKDGYMGAEIQASYDSQSEMGMLTGDAISIRITGRELDDLRDTALAVAEIVRGVEGTKEIDDGSERAAPEYRIRVDKDKAMANGLTTAQVFLAAMEAINNPQAKMNMMLSGQDNSVHDFEIVIKDAAWTEPDKATVENIILTGMTGQKVALKDVAELYEDVGFSSISRNNNARFITVSGEIEDGYNVTLVNEEIERRLKDYIPPEGCSVSIEGESEAILSAFGDLYLMLLLALIFIYLIMVAQFQSLLSPFIVMFTIPLAFTGGFLALLIANTPISVVAMIGLILLTGVVVNNGIVFVDCVNRLRREGLDKKEALVQAGRIRIRPIIMTALTTIVAMSTMTLGMGQGTETVQPMALTVVGGLIYATLMTLFVVPCMYDILHRNRDMSKDEDLDYDKAEAKNNEAKGTL